MRCQLMLSAWLGAAYQYALHGYDCKEALHSGLRVDGLVQCDFDPVLHREAAHVSTLGLRTRRV